jgi:hypothetical protein
MAKPKRTEEDDLFEQGEDVDTLFEQGADVEDAAPFEGATASASQRMPTAGRTPGAGESFVQGAANAFGTGDLIGAGLQAAMQVDSDIAPFLRGDLSFAEGRQRMRDTFSDARKENLRLTQTGMAEHPVASIAGRMLPGAMLAPATGAANTLAASGVTGALTGALEGAASSGAESAGDVAGDAATGAAFGGAGGVLGYGAGKYVLAPVGAWLGQKFGKALASGGENIEDSFRRFAQERALKASGYIQKDLPDERPAMDALLQRGQRILDEPGLIRVGSSAAAIGERAEPLKKAAGQQIGQFLEQADEAAGYGAGPFNPYAWAAEAKRAKDAGLWRGGPFNPYQLAERARAQGGVIDEALLDPNLQQQGRVMNEWMDDTLKTADQLSARGQPFTFQRANEYKGGLQEGLYNNKGLPRPNKEVANAFQRDVIDAIDDQAEPLIGTANVDAFRTARQRYGDFNDVTKRSAQQVNREVGNNFMGLKDMQAGQMAQGSKGLEDLPYVGPAAALASKLLRGRMDSTAARAADAVAGSGTLAQLRGMSPEVVGGYGAAVGAAAGGATADWLTTLAQTNPEALGRWGQYLGAAASQSPEALGAAHRELSETDPDYQQAMRRNGGQSQ